MIYFNESYLTIHKLEEAACMVMEWKMFVTGEKFRNGLDKGLSVLQKSGYKKWLADLRKMQTLTAEDQEWINKEWFPRALEAGMEKMAIIESKDIFDGIAVDNRMSRIINTNLTVQYFDKMEDALEWLESQ